MRLAFLVALAGCGGFIDKQAASSTQRILDSSQVAARRLGDVEVARAGLAAGIVQLQSFALAYPKHGRFAEMHADAVCDFATAFVFDDWEDASLAGRTGEAREAADRLRPLLRECISLEEARLPRGWTPERLRPADVPAALAIGRARAVLIALDPMSSFGQLPALRTLLERCAALRPGYHDADAELLLGVLAAAPGGGDGDAWFAKAAALAGDGALMIDVMRSRSDRAALQRVADADLSRWPERRLANTLAVRKARRYLTGEVALLPR